MIAINSVVFLETIQYSAAKDRIIDKYIVYI